MFIDTATMSINSFYQSRTKRLAVTLGVAFGLMLIAAVVHDEQLEVFGNPAYPLYMVRQVFFESVAQPFYLFVVMAPIAVAAWFGVSAGRLVSGGFVLLATLLPLGAFTYVRVSNGELVGYHNSLHQLAAPLHEMPAMLPALLLMMIGGVMSLAWRAGPVAAFSAVGLVSAAIGWAATEGAGAFVIDDRTVISFPTSALLFGYYIGWLGVLAAIADSALRKKRRSKTNV